MSPSLLADRCECSYREGLPPCYPESVIYTGHDALRADYHCRRCGRQWFTGWGALACGWPTELPRLKTMRELVDDLLADLRSADAGDAA
jgi:hypothetical protein